MQDHANRRPQKGRLECVDSSNLFRITGAALLAMMLIAVGGDLAGEQLTETVRGVYYENFRAIDGY